MNVNGYEVSLGIESNSLKYICSDGSTVCKLLKKHYIVDSKKVNFIIYKLCLDRAFIKKKWSTGSKKRMIIHCHK